MFRRKSFFILPSACFLLFGTLALAQAPQPPILPGTISTVDTPGSTLYVPSGVAVDGQNHLYIADTANNKVLKVDQQSHAVSVVNVTVSGPEGLALDADGNLYIAEFGDKKDVLKLATDGTTTTVASGLINPASVAYDNAGHNLYIADYGLITANSNILGRVVKVDANGAQSNFNVPGGVVHPSGIAYANGYLYLVDNGTGVLERVNVATTAVDMLKSGLDNPWGVALDAAGDIYYSLYGHFKQTGGQVLIVNPNPPLAVSLVAGSGGYGYDDAGGAAQSASFRDSVAGITVAADGSLYIADGSNNLIRKVTFPAPATGTGGGTPAPTPTPGGGTPAPAPNPGPGAPPPVVAAPVINTIPGCTVISFSAGPNPVYTYGSYGITTVLANVTCAYEVRIGSPSGPLFATGNGYSSTITGNWVSEGMQFYLQQSGNMTPQGTLAEPITMHLKPGVAGLACVATAFSASPNPIITNEQYGQTTITAVTNCSFDIRIGAPDGPEFQEGRGFAAMQTGKWVYNGMTMYLQPHGDTSASDTLSMLKLIVQPQPTGCTVNSFNSPDNPIKTTERLNTIKVNTDATCAYDVHVSSPDGAILGSGSGQTSLSTGNWVTNGMSFFLQQSGVTSAAGTLANFTVNTKLPDQAARNCTITRFDATGNPLIAAGGSGQTTVNVNAACAWDLRLNDSAGAVLASGNGAGTATAAAVTNGTLFYLQPHNDTYYADNLAILNATVAPQAPAGCTALVFTATPVQSDSSFGVSTISADATCPYDVRIDSPDGAIFASGQGFTSANTGNWVLFGQRFFLQKQGDTTAAGTLATQSAIVLP